MLPALGGMCTAYSGVYQLKESSRTRETFGRMYYIQETVTSAQLGSIFWCLLFISMEVVFVHEVWDTPFTEFFLLVDVYALKQNNGI